MASRKLSAQEVASLLDQDWSLDPEMEPDDPDEVLVEGSDEEYDKLEDLYNGTKLAL